MALDLCPTEIEVLRVLNGEDSDMPAGAAMWVCCSYLKGIGLATGHYEITQAGRDYLARLDAGVKP